MTDDEHPAWIDSLAKLSRFVGMNPTQVRWRLIRWNERRKQPASADAPRTPILRRLGLSSPEAISVSTLLALVIMTTYARVWVAQGGGFSAPSGALLFDFGAQWQRRSPDAWRLVTPIFLHIGLWHLLFNLVSLATVGPQVESIWGRTTMLFVFIATGVIGNLGSGLAQPDVISAGASGGICGLIGAAAGYGHRLGTTRGITLRNDMLKWLLYTIVFGFALSANNYAHAFGAVSGGAFGYFVSPQRWRKSVLEPVRAIAKTVGVVATIGALVIILTRKPENHDGGDIYYEINLQIAICKILERC
ncbi:MAG: rhomboid family intramembrane serine protease [Kofleriaceae bacterium]